MNSWIPKKNILQLAIIIVSLSVLVYFLGLFFIFSQTKKLEDSYFNSESESFKEKKVAAITGALDKNEKSIKSLQDIFIKKDDEVRFIEQIESIARKSSLNFEISSIDVDNKQTDSFKEEVKVQLKFEGSWRNSMLFLSELEKMPFIVQVENLSLDLKNSGNWSGNVDFIVFREK